MKKTMIIIYAIACLSMNLQIQCAKKKTPKVRFTLPQQNPLNPQAYTPREHHEDDLVQSNAQELPPASPEDLRITCEISDEHWTKFQQNPIILENINVIFHPHVPYKSQSKDSPTIMWTHHPEHPFCVTYLFEFKNGKITAHQFTQNQIHQEMLQRLKPSTGYGCCVVA